MSFWNKILETIKGNEDFSELKSSSFRDFLNGNILNKNFVRRQFVLMILIAVLAFFYIDNRYYCEKQISEEVNLKQELQDIKFESLTISAQLTTLGRRTYVLNYINEKGLELKESSIAPVIIEEPDLKKEEEIKKAKEEHQKATEKIKQDTTQNEESIGR